MAGIDVGGDSSVEWKVKADHVRTEDHNPNGPGGVIHHGIDETDFGAANGFWVTLKMPKDAANAATFVSSLCTACADAQANQNVPAYAVSFTMPIEDFFTSKIKDQIHIEWKSKPLAPGHLSFAAKALASKGKGKPAAKKKSSAKKRSARPASKKKAARKRK
jgi:hypothetical protein